MADEITAPHLSTVDNETPALRRSSHAVLTIDEVGDEPVRVELLGTLRMVARIGDTPVTIKPIGAAS